MGNFKGIFYAAPDSVSLRVALRIASNSFRQGFYTTPKCPGGLRGVFAFGTFILYNTMLTTMYCSMVIALLTARRSPRAVEDLGDLLKDDFKHIRFALDSFWPLSLKYSFLRILVKNNSFTHETLRNHEIYSKIEDRIDFYGAFAGDRADIDAIKTLAQEIIQISFLFNFTLIESKFLI